VTSGAELLFRSSAQEGYSEAVADDKRHVRARKVVQEVQVEFCTVAYVLQTREGLVHVRPGDAVMTGTAGERWRISRDRFAKKYCSVAPTVMGESGRYQSLPNSILAVAMDRPFEVVLRDGVSRLHGNVGDWLVDYGDGSLGIVSSAIFANTYEIVD